MNEYYIDTLLGDESKCSPHKFDSQGVMLTKVPYTQEYHYHATAIASYAISNINIEEIFNSQVKWLVNNIKKDGSYVHDFVLPFYEFEKSWVGGLAQGLSISALIRAYDRYNDKIYLETAKKALQGLEKHCMFKDEEGNYWISEFPGVPTILNGFIYALFGVYDVVQKGNNKANSIWNECITTLEKNIDKYDMGYWSRYDLKTGIPATPFYHKIHIKQLSVLSDLTSIKRFKVFSDKWEKRANKKYNNFRVKLKRNTMIVKKHGITGTYRRYDERKKWLKGGDIT